MFAEVVAIGDELTSGQRLDTNSQWISQQLEEQGIEVRFHTTIGDDLDSNIQAFQIALKRAALVISTGGLGPTDDDLTRQALASATQLELELDKESLEHIRKRFESRGRTMPPKNQVQAMFPAGCRVIPNPNGTAPGIDLNFQNAHGPTSRFIALPGVPIEMKEMWAETVLPTLATAGDPTRRVIRHHVVKCFGVGESHMESKLPDLIQRGRQPRVGITVHQATISLRITAQGKDAAQCLTQIEETVQQIHQQVGDLVFGEGEDELQDTVVQSLRERGETLSVVESSTSGLLANWLGMADPSREVFQQARIVAPSTDDQSMVDIANALHVESSSTYVIKLSNFQPEGTYELYVITPKGTIKTTSQIAGHPEIWAPRMAKQGLDLLRKILRDR